MITIKTPQEIEIMSQGGHLLAQIRDNFNKIIKKGMTTKQLDTLAYDKIISVGGTPSFLNFNGYPSSICTSINNEIVHGIPDGYILQDGDIIGIDIGMKYKGFHNDTAITIPVGTIKPAIKELLRITRQSLYNGITHLIPGQHLGDVQNAIQNTIEKANFGIVRDLTGHGIGKELQEEPSIPNFGKKGTGIILQEGMVLAIEPMVTLGNPKVILLDDGWTIATADGSPAAHFEHTIAITKQGAKILTI